MCIRLLNIQGIVRNLLKPQEVTKDHLLNCMSGHCLFTMNKTVNKGTVAVLPFILLLV
jgi:hypothetical protein